MARCKYCGAETQTYEPGFPICVNCLNKKPSREQIVAILRERLAAAQQHRDEASDRFNLLLREAPGRADGANNVQKASNEYRLALDDVLTAFRALNDFLLNGANPPDLPATPQKL